jgi:serine/threonine protein kinase
MSNIPESISETLERLSDKFTIEMLDEQGANGYVFKATNNVLGSNVVIKFYYWGSEDKFHVEPKTLLQLDSPYILKVLDADVVDDEWAYFVTPFCSEGNLDKRLGSNFISNVEAVNRASDILQGLSALHAERLIHRDLKLGNVYLHDNRAIIGDFGSVASLPKDKSSVAASQHSVLYRPPESVETNEYTAIGDIYQTGVILYQLLGGPLPYNEVEWLNKQQREQYNQLPYPENTVFADQCLMDRITRDRLLDFGGMPPWTCDRVKRIARKAAHSDPSRRYSSAAEFLAKLAESLPSVRDWHMQDGCLTLTGSTCYRIIKDNSVFRVQKRKTSPDWRNDNTLTATENLRELILEIEKCV